MTITIYGPLIRGQRLVSLEEYRSTVVRARLYALAGLALVPVFLLYRSAIPAGVQVFLVGLFYFLGPDFTGLFTSYDQYVAAWNVANTAGGAERPGASWPERPGVRLARKLFRTERR